MKKLTFCLYSANDLEDEQERVKLSLISLLSQNTDASCVVFMDCTFEGNRFQVPNHSDLKVIYRPTKPNKGFHAGMIRNEAALASDTEIICHVNADCFYSPSFAAKVIQYMGDGNRFICCHRLETNAEQWGLIKREGMPAVFQLKKDLACVHPSAFGECQGIIREQFMAAGGYYRLIKNGIQQPGTWDHTAQCEDANMMQYIRRTDVYQNVRHSIRETWIDRDPEAWIVHLYHPTRPFKTFYENNKTGYWRQEEINKLAKYEEAK